MNSIIRPLKKSRLPLIAGLVCTRAFTRAFTLAWVLAWVLACTLAGLLGCNRVENPHADNGAVVTIDTETPGKTIDPMIFGGSSTRGLDQGNSPTAWIRSP